MSSTALYTDLSAYYDLMCADINYREQSDFVRRAHTLFGNKGKRCLDLGCGTGPHVRHFLDNGFTASGLDIHQPMLDIAQQRCPEADFIQADMANFKLATPVDVITCFLYSIHYNPTHKALMQCFAQVYAALTEGGIFCFNAVNKDTIDNNDCASYSIIHEGSDFMFQSGWQYAGEGDRQYLLARIEKTTQGVTEVWQDQHAMVAISFSHLQHLLASFFEVEIFEHNYAILQPWLGVSGNAIFVCTKKG